MRLFGGVKECVYPVEEALFTEGPKNTWEEKHAQLLEITGEAAAVLASAPGSEFSFRVRQAVRAQETYGSCR